jgi:hypothetical protein
VKKVAKIFGADLVGVYALNSWWVYSHWYNLRTFEEKLIELPEDFRKYAIAIEIEYEMFKTFPKEAGWAATCMGYFRMEFVAGFLAHFIRDLAYRAIVR